VLVFGVSLLVESPLVVSPSAGPGVGVCAGGVICRAVGGAVGAAHEGACGVRRLGWVRG
jgi:hypothetical protein